MDKKYFLTGMSERRLTKAVVESGSRFKHKFYPHIRTLNTLHEKLGEKMNVKKMIFIALVLIIFSGCLNKDKNLTLEPKGNQPMGLVKLASDEKIDQQPSNNAKELLSNYEEISGVRAVNHNNQLVVAVDVDHDDRFNLDNIERDVSKKIKRDFSNMKVTISTDQKILLELEDLENALQKNNISEKELKKRLQEIKKLSKEQT